MPTASRFKFTPRGINALSLPEGKVQADYWDEQLTGFGIRISGARKTPGREPTRTWQVLRSVKKDGKWTVLRVAIGRYPATALAVARDRARKTLTDIDSGLDVRRVAREDAEARQRDDAVAEAKTKAATTYARIVERYLTDRASEPKKNRVARREKTIDGYRRVLLSVTTWHDKPIAEVTDDMVGLLIDETKAAKGHTHANTLYVFLRAMFRWAKKKKLIVVVPTDYVDEPPKPAPRERPLTDDEQRMLWRSLPDGWVFTPWAKLLLLLGQRRDEIASLRWSEVFDLSTDRAYIELAGGDAHRVKNDRRHKVPLSKQAADILRALHAEQEKAADEAQESAAEEARAAGSAVPQRKPLDYVFTTTGKSAISGFSKAKVWLDNAIDAGRHVAISEAEALGDAVALERRERAFREPWRFHDLRHTFATGAAELGIEPHVIDAVTNHVSVYRSGVSGRYNHSENLQAKRDALEKWAAHIDRMVAA